MHYFYILQSQKNQKLYVGQTPNLRSRLKSHNAGENRATKPNIPYELIFYSAFKSEKDAINCEQYFKTTSGWKRLRKMLEETLKAR
ncbi:GIY-YIG nuclease family protein [Patescibacteria group bacterium]|nr:GIY-YIG nuclease family protein [Patescibacteria group bacterium]